MGSVRIELEPLKPSTEVVEPPPNECGSCYGAESVPTPPRLPVAYIILTKRTTNRILGSAVTLAAKFVKPIARKAGLLLILKVSSRYVRYRRLLNWIFSVNLNYIVRSRRLQREPWETEGRRLPDLWPYSCQQSILSTLSVNWSYLRLYRRWQETSILLLASPSSHTTCMCMICSHSELQLSIWPTTSIAFLSARNSLV